MKKEYPTLYKKTSTGAIQYWTIGVQRHLGDDWADIFTRYGQVDGKEQVTTDTIDEGKNIGRSNETTPFEQAVAEATSKWEKQKKKGYVESIKAAEKGDLDALIEGGILPMLAHKFTEQAHKIKYPAFVQPKLDGIRCIAILKNGTCTLWSRTRKPITGVPHIARAIEKAFKKDIVLDGELYNHDFKKEFEKIVSFVRQEDPADGHEVVEYHVYDLVTDDSFIDRAKQLNEFAAKNFYGPLVKVVTEEVTSEEAILDHFNICKSLGYEGCMVRNSSSKYVNKRSYDLQKVKEFDDGEFEIIGVTEGRGKLAGHAIFVCLAENGTEFEAKMKGDTAMLKRYFEEHKLWKGKKLTVKYQGLTGANKVPRFPVGHAIRDYE